MKKISTLFEKDNKDLSKVINKVNPINQWVYEGYAIPTRKFDGTACAIIDKELYKRYDVKPNKKKVVNFQIGNIVCKKSVNPFKNGELTDEIVDLVINPQSPTNAPSAKLKNSDTIVNLANLTIVGNWKIEDFKNIPKGAIPCQEPDIITGHYPHWLKCDRNNKEDKYHFEAFDRLLDFLNKTNEYYENNFKDGQIQAWSNLGNYLSNKPLQDNELYLLQNHADKTFKLNEIIKKFELCDGTYELCGEKIQGNKEKITGYKLIKHDIEILPITDFSFEGLKDYLSKKENNIEGIVFHHKFTDQMCKIRKSDFGFIR